MLLLVRHAAATGQEPEASLTVQGHEQAQKLAQFVKDYFRVDRIISSPLTRALQTAAPFGETIEIDDRLKERVLGAKEDWQGELEKSFADFDYRCGEGETNNEGLRRAESFLADTITDDTETVVAVSHGNLCTLLLRKFIPNFTWQQLSNPDIYAIDVHRKLVSRVWTGSGPRVRESSRAVLVNPTSDRVFMFQIHDEMMHLPDHPGVKRAWITPGGGVEQGETDHMVTLKRELFEEVGLSGNEYDIHNHILSCRRIVWWKGQLSCCFDHFHVVRLRSDRLTESETECMVEGRWWTWKELSETRHVIIPDQLRTIELDTIYS